MARWPRTARWCGRRRPHGAIAPRLATIPGMCTTWIRSRRRGRAMRESCSGAAVSSSRARCSSTARVSSRKSSWFRRSSAWAARKTWSRLNGMATPSWGPLSKFRRARAASWSKSIATSTAAVPKCRPRHTPAWAFSARGRSTRRKSPEATGARGACPTKHQARRSLLRVRANFWSSRPAWSRTTHTAQPSCAPFGSILSSRWPISFWVRSNPAS